CLLVSPFLLLAPHNYWDRLAAAVPSNYLKLRQDSDLFAADIPPLEDTSPLKRLNMLRLGLHILVEHPLDGIGRGDYKATYEHYASQVDFAVPAGPLGLHNTPLQIAAETGLVGLGPFAAT